MASALTGQVVSVPVLNDPQGMRPADKRYWEGKISEHLLADGQTVYCIWLPLDQQRVNIVVWDSTGETWTVENIYRFHAAPETEKLLQALEA
jgi:hypothetical protein